MYYFYLNSAVFNIFGVISVCGLFAGRKIPLDWYPITRDCVVYGITVLLLIIILVDEKVSLWHIIYQNPLLLHITINPFRRNPLKIIIEYLYLILGILVGKHNFDHVLHLIHCNYVLQHTD